MEGDLTARGSENHLALVNVGVAGVKSLASPKTGGIWLSGEHVADDPGKPVGSPTFVRKGPCYHCRSSSVTTFLLFSL